MRYLLLMASFVLFVACDSEPKSTLTVLQIDAVNFTTGRAMLRGDNNYIKQFSLEQGVVFTDSIELPEDGYYQVFVDRERTDVYLEQGKSLTVSVNVKEFDESIKYTGGLAKENNYLAAKYLFDATYDVREVFSKTEEAFSENILALNLGKVRLLEQAEINNNDFLKREQSELVYEHASNLESYEYYHRYFTKNDSFTVSDNFYEQLDGISFKDTIAFRKSSAYRDLLSVHYNRVARASNDNNDSYNKTIAYLTALDKNLPNGFAKESLMASYLEYGLSPDEGLDRAFQIFKNSQPSTTVLESVRKRYEKLSTITPGKVSPKFDFENFNGGTTSLADLKGKNVYIDVWATWCGPCIREIPSLKQLEEDYKDANIAFVSISIDEKRDYEKWKRFIPARELGGIQLMAPNDWNTKFIKDYAIDGIPRFIILDTEGKIISGDAPRPSDPEIRKMLDQLI